MTAERLRTADFDYDLPPELVAQEPLPERSASRMLMVLRHDRRLGGAPDRRAAEAAVETADLLHQLEPGAEPQQEGFLPA